MIANCTFGKYFSFHFPVDLKALLQEVVWNHFG